MIKKIRIGNSVHAKFTCDGYDLSTVENLSVTLSCGDSIITEKYTFDEGSIVLDVDKKDETEIGMYHLYISFVLNGDDVTYDTDLFEIVPLSALADVNEIEDIETIDIVGNVDLVSSVARDYEELKNKPSINNVELDGNKTLDELGIAPKDSVITNEERAKLASLENYDDTELRGEIDAMEDTILEFNGVINQKTQSAIAECKAFTISEDKKLLAMIENLQVQINDIKKRL